MSKKVIVSLLALFFILLFATIPLHLQKGLTWNNDFWQQKDENFFQYNRHNYFRFHETDEGIVFDLMLNGQESRIISTALADGLYRFESTNGWAIEITNSPYVSISVANTFFLPGDYALVITDADHPSYQFAACRTEFSYYYDETGQPIGEHTALVTDNGEYIGGYETWYNQPEFNTELPETIVWKDGLRITSDQAYNALFINEEGEYLLDSNLLFSIQTWDDAYVSKAGLLHLLLDAVQGDAARRGHIMCFMLYIPFYLLGLAMLKWPQELAFLGSRWQYRYEPELSDAGLASMQISAVIIMIISVALLFLPIFGGAS